MDAIEKRMIEIAKVKNRLLPKDLITKLKDEPEYIIRNSINKEITVVFSDNTRITGILESFSEKELYLNHQKNGSFTVFRDAIKYIEEHKISIWDKILGIS